MRYVILLSALLWTAAPTLPVCAEAPIFPEGAELEHLFTRTANINLGSPEGPAVAPDGTIYFTDIPLAQDHSMIMHFDPKTKKVDVFSDNSGKANGMKFDADGNLVVCEGADYGGRRVAKW